MNTQTSFDDEINEILVWLLDVNPRGLSEEQREEYTEAARRMLDNYGFLRQRREFKARQSAAGKSGRKRKPSTRRLEMQVRTLWHEQLVRVASGDITERDIAGIIHPKLTRPVSLTRVRELIKDLNLRSS